MHMPKIPFYDLYMQLYLRNPTYLASKTSNLA